ncbi:MAG: Rpn family recombination-promoting nuclease/putative transposase [Firmicutes bacterium]|nr:Rpn family recombination-promoting nuclease/putative transposase [Bacillota bacterium]
MKSSKKYTLKNPIMFSVIMQDRNRCIGLLERIFPGRKVQELNYVHQEKDKLAEPEIERTYIVGIDVKAIRMDVLFEDSNAWYDIEMQIYDMGNLPKRSRYYHAVKTVDSLQRGTEYTKLKEGYVIFINDFDIFGFDEPVYSFEMFDKNLQLNLNDGQHTIFLNSKCRNNVPAELEGFYHYLQTGEVKSGDDWLTEMAVAVEDVNSRKEVLDNMTVYEEIKMLENIVEEKDQEIAANKRQLEAKDQELARSKQLTLILAQQGRTDDLVRASEDEAYRDKLFAEFNI